ncbi:MAG TPA: M20 peptidase family dipeptidase, partial [Casimicrobiaceae bacterium]|nr:M20 peptidase family dipeptidase [Casimicrobiaceae bacterium]
MSTPRTAAIAAAASWFDSGALLAELKRRVAFRTESQDPARAAALASYLNEDIGPSVSRCGFEWAIWPNPVPGAPPL